MSTAFAMPETRQRSPEPNVAAARANVELRTAGGWFAAASLLMIAVFALHGPISPDMVEQMARISAAPVRWKVAHWLAAASLSFYAITGLLVLSARSRLTASGTTLSAWAVVSIGALWTLTTAIAEATTVTAAAIAGDRETFEAWWAFAEGKATGFAFVAVAIAIIAWHESGSSERVTPPWFAQIGAVAGLASFAGWALGMWLGVRAGSLVWVAASIVMSVWTLWLGLGLMKRRMGDAGTLA